MSYYNQRNERLIFKKVEKENVSDWTTFFENNSGLKYLGINLNHSPNVLAENWINKQLKRYKESGLGHLAVFRKEDDVLIGMGGIIPRDINGHKEYEVAYSVIPRFWNVGYATEISKQLTSYAIKNIKQNRFISIININNIASIKVATKNGFELCNFTNFNEMEVGIFSYTNNQNSK